MSLRAQQDIVPKSSSVSGVYLRMLLLPSDCTSSSLILAVLTVLLMVQKNCIGWLINPGSTSHCKLMDSCTVALTY